MATVLIASLGDSPVVVTAMFDLLRKEGKDIEQLEVFYPETEFALTSYDDLIYEALQQKCKENNITCGVSGISILDESAGAEYATYDFLHKLAKNLDEHQKKGDNVYLSLAGGRKSMAALMGLLAPLFPCVKELYHIFDQDETHFLTTQELCDVSAADQQYLLFPKSNSINLLSIPYNREQQFSAEVRSRLFALTEEQLDELWERDAEQAEVAEFYSPLMQGNDEGGLLTVELTANAAEQYQELLQHDVNRSRKFTTCFKQMHYARRLMAALRINQEDGAHGAFFYKPFGLTFHFYKSHRHTVERSVYHTEPQDIAATSAAYINKVVISELEFKKSGRYRSLEEIVTSPKFSLEGRVSFDRAFPEESGSQEHILIVPLATSPMVATQLYQLYIDRGHKVHSVILVHTQHPDVRKSVKIVRGAFEDAGVKCEAVPLKDYKDIDTSKACKAYQELLEKTIQKMRDENASCQIDLTISGGRKGMAALATFAAQRKGIRRVVHTVIHERLNDKVTEETTIEELNKLINTNNTKKCNDRLFLRAYKDDKDAFVLFTIPVIPAQGG